MMCNGKCLVEGESNENDGTDCVAIKSNGRKIDGA